MTKNMSENCILKPWLNNDVFSLIRFKHYLYNEYKTGYEPFNVYDDFMRSIKRGIDLVKQSFIGKQILASQGNSKETWENIDKCIEPLSNKKIK